MWCLRKVTQNLSTVSRKTPVLMLKLVACAGSPCTAIGCQSTVRRTCHHRRVSVTAICLLAAIPRSHHCCSTSWCLWLLQELLVIIRSVICHEQLCCMLMTTLPPFLQRQPCMLSGPLTHSRTAVNRLTIHFDAPAVQDCLPPVQHLCTEWACVDYVAGAAIFS